MKGEMSAVQTSLSVAFGSFANSNWLAVHTETKKKRESVDNIAW